MAGNSNSGRPKKSNEQELISKLDNIITVDAAVQKLAQLIDEGNFNALKLYMHYRYGQPQKRIEISTQDKEIPLFNIVYKSTEQIEADHQKQLNINK